MAEVGFRKWIITLTVVTAAVMELIDTSIVNVALTDMSGNLGATLEDVAWVVTSYAIANVIIIPMTSFLGALFGRRKYYIGSIILFTTASILCGNAHNIWELVAFRFIQGIGGGALLSTSQAILFETFPMAQRGLASAIFGLGVFIGPTIGPTIGGWLVDNYSWPWIFYVNLPVGIAATILAFILVKEPTEQRAAGKIDWTGIGLLVMGLGSLQTVLERGETDDWFSAPYIVVLTAMAAFSLISFVIWELKIPNPVVDLRVLKSRTLAIAASLTFVNGVVLFSTVFIVPVFVQRLLGFTATQTGVLYIPGVVVAFVVLPQIGRLMGKGFPPHYLVIGGFLVVATFCWQLSTNSLASGASDFFIPIILRAVGLAMLIVPLTSLAVSGLKGKDISQGVALNNMMRQLGGSFGIALINTYIAHRVFAHRSALLDHLGANDPYTQTRLAGIAQNLMSHGAYFDSSQAPRIRFRRSRSGGCRRSTLGRAPSAPVKGLRL